MSKKIESDKIYSILLDLYSHQPINFKIKGCKISPKLPDGIRDDLEFYIPQFW